MTSWQWSVIVTLCKVVIKIIDKDEIYRADSELLRRAIEREDIKNV